MPKRLAEIVVDSALSTRADVVRAARVADDEKLPLVVALVRQVGVDELALVSAIRRQVRISLTDPATVEPDPDAIRELARDTCWRLRAMPLSVTYPNADTKVLHMAMADPTDAVAIAEIEHLTGSQVAPSLMPLSAVEEMVESAYKAFVTEVMPRRKRKPFGADLDVTTQPMAKDGPADVPESEANGGGETKPTTVPFHRVSDEAQLELRFQALLELLDERGILALGDYDERVRSLMKQRDEDE